MRDDPHSYADLEQARTTSVALELEVDFPNRRLSGRVTLQLEQPCAGPLDLDTRGLLIQQVHDGEGREVPFALAEPDEVLGARLRLDPPAPSDRFTLVYRTGPDASGLMWLSPDQTAGDHPFVLSQCQAIHARSLVPLQDTPKARIRYTARVTVPSFATAVMSAAPGDVEELGAVRRFDFEMPQPIPPYLLALAAGDLEARDLGPRCRVYAEPPVVDAAAWEFADVEAMLTAAEGLFGPYPWERYDFIVLPPSFPMGGMENPRMTFLTPTLLAGDRSLVGVLAHELAHSWTGNLVTNADNQHFWLNEGWTVWAERRILEALYGRDEAVQQAVLGRRALDATIEDLESRGISTALCFDQSGLDPDDVFSTLPYEKGFLLITALEQAVGRERFDAFVQRYLDTFRFQSIDSATFSRFVREQLPDAGVDLHAWIHEPGVPSTAPTFRSERLDDLAAAAREGRLPQASDLTTTEKLTFLQHAADGLDAHALAEALGIDERSNAEVRSAWLALALRRGADVFGPARAFVDTVGRTKLLKPVIKALASRDRARAAEWVQANLPRWHASTRIALQRLV